MGISQRLRSAKHRIGSAIASRLGLRVHHPDVPWWKNERYLSTLETSPFAAPNAGVHERRFVLWQLAASLVDVKGDLFECGVYRGQGAYWMMSGAGSSRKRYFGVDSFQGLSRPQPVDSPRRGDTRAWKLGDMRASEEDARRNLVEFSDRIHIYAGWIPEVFDQLPEAVNFSLAHIDVDLYLPTLRAAQFAWSRLSVGGLLVCDDYGFETCPGAQVAMDEFAETIGAQVVMLPTGQGLIFKHAS